MTVKGIITERVKLAPHLAEQMLDVQDGYVHTFVGAGMTMVGCDWEVDVVKKLIREHGVELAGELATTVGHGLVVTRPKSSPLFLATKEGSSGDEQH